MAGRTKRADELSGDDAETAIHMLKNMQISGVALVPRGANNRLFVLAKNAGDNTAMKLNPAVKAAALSAMRECLDKTSSAYALVSGSEEDASSDNAEELASLFKMLSEETGQYADKFGKKKKPPAEMDKTAGAAAAQDTSDGASDVAKAGKKLSAASLREITTAHNALKKLLDSADADAGDVSAAPASNAPASAAPVAKSIEQAVTDGVAAGVEIGIAAALAKASPAPATSSAPAQEPPTQTRVIAPPTNIEQGAGAGVKPPPIDLFAAPDFGAAYSKYISSTGRN